MDQKENDQKQGKNIFSQLAWWSIDKAELEEQVSKYKLLGMTKSVRKISFLMILGLVLLNLILVEKDIVATETYYLIGAYFILALLIYKGFKFAMVITMLLWTLDKGFSLYQTAKIATENNSANGIGLLVNLLFWSLIMRYLFASFKVEPSVRSSL